MAFTAALFPTELALDSHGGPMFQTTIVVTRDGAEHRNRSWEYARWRWEVGLVHRTEAQTRLLQAFFRVVARGQQHTFLFQDPAPGGATLDNDLLSTGTGARVSFPLRKRYTVGGQTYQRWIVHPDLETLVVTVDGDPVAWTFDAATAAVVLETAPASGAAVRASGSFLAEVRFETDHLGLTYVEPGLYSWESIPLLEERFAAPPVPPPEAPVLSGILAVFADWSLGAQLTWTAPVDPDLLLIGYRLYRCSGTGTPTDLVAETPALTYDDVVTITSTGMTYAVTAYGDHGESPQSNLVFLVPLDEPWEWDGQALESGIFGESITDPLTL